MTGTHSLSFLPVNFDSLHCLPVSLPVFLLSHSFFILLASRERMFWPQRAIETANGLSPSRADDHSRTLTVLNSNMVRSCHWFFFFFKIAYKTGIKTEWRQRNQAHLGLIFLPGERLKGPWEQKNVRQKVNATFKVFICDGTIWTIGFNRSSPSAGP